MAFFRLELAEGFFKQSDCSLFWKFNDVIVDSNFLHQYRSWGEKKSV
jgi:hypothetical protein